MPLKLPGRFLHIAQYAYLWKWCDAVYNIVMLSEICNTDISCSTHQKLPKKNTTSKDQIIWQRALADTHLKQLAEIGVRSQAYNFLNEQKIEGQQRNYRVSNSHFLQVSSSDST